MQDCHRMVRKCPTLLCHWRLAQYKEKSQLWSWLILGTRPPKACPPAPCGQCYTQVITHLDRKSAFSHLEALTPHSSYLWASRAEPDPLLQVPISENKVSYLFQSLIHVLHVGAGLCKVTKMHWSTQQEHRKTGKVHPSVYAVPQSSTERWLNRIIMQSYCLNSFQLCLLWLADDNSSSPSVSPWFWKAISF